MFLLACLPGHGTRGGDEGREGKELRGGGRSVRAGLRPALFPQWPDPVRPKGTRYRARRQAKTAGPLPGSVPGQRRHLCCRARAGQDSGRAAEGGPPASFCSQLPPGRPPPGFGSAGVGPLLGTSVYILLRFYLCYSQYFITRIKHLSRNPPRVLLFFPSISLFSPFLSLRLSRGGGGGRGRKARESWGRGLRRELPRTECASPPHPFPARRSPQDLPSPSPSAKA